MFNPEKIAAIIEHLSKKIEATTVYKLACDLAESELVELRKHFEVTIENGYGDFDHRYVFTKKK